MTPRERRVARDCWCGADSASVLFAFRHEGTPLRYVRCQRCGVVAQWPQVNNEILAAAYSQDYYGKGRTKFVGPVARLVSSFQGHRARQVTSLLKNHGPGARILDVGCGNGGFLQNLRGMGWKNAEGTEWSTESARRVPKGIRVHVGDLLDLNLEEKSYSAVVIWHVLEHLRRPDATLAECHRLLKPGGLLFVALPNQDSNQALRYGPKWFHLDPPRHLFGFGPASLARLTRQSGFNMFDVHTFSLEQDPYGWIQSQLNAWGYPRERAYATLKRTGSHGTMNRLTDLALVSLLAPWGLSAAVFSALFDRGATLSIVAQKD